MTCKNCNTPLPDDALFCAECGAPAEKAPAADSMLVADEPAKKTAVKKTTKKTEENPAGDKKTTTSKSTKDKEESPVGEKKTAVKKAAKTAEEKPAEIPVAEKPAVAAQEEKPADVPVPVAEVPQSAATVPALPDAAVPVPQPVQPVIPQGTQPVMPQKDPAAAMRADVPATAQPTSYGTQAMPYGVQPMPYGQQPMQQAQPVTPTNCVTCGAPLAPGAGFCGNCGTVVTPALLPYGGAVMAPARKPMSKKTVRLLVILAVALVVLVGGFFGGRAIYRNARYNTATQLMSSGNYQEAQDIFESLPEDYKDVASNAFLCQQNINYDNAKALYDTGNYQAALPLFQALGGFKDSQTLATDCSNHITYDRATTLYNQGKYYDAYKLFMSISSFQDSTDMAKACIQPMPPSGVLFKDETFTGTNVWFRAYNKLDQAMYLEFYDSDGVLVAKLFVQPGGSAEVLLRPGTYTIKRGVGAYWFGEEDLFGDDAYYVDLVDENGSKEHTFLGNYIYEYTVSFN